MNILVARRISQVFFFLLFLWFCVVATFGEEWLQLRGWPVNWFLQLDPLVALGTALATGALYSGLAWAVVTIVLTILLGRFFCGWVCPFGSIHHVVGFLGKRRKSLRDKLEMSRPGTGQSTKYYILLFLLSAAGGAAISGLVRSGFSLPFASWALAGLTVAFAALTLKNLAGNRKRIWDVLLLLFGVWTALAFFLSVDRMIGASLQTGLLDPIPLVYRSFNLVLLPLSDSSAQKIFIAPRYYEGAWLIASVFVIAVLLNLKRPRFYCRYVCPLGALFGVLGRHSLWRMGKTTEECVQCGLCEANCEGACEPAGRIRLHECVLCMNCLKECRHDLIAYRTAVSASGESVVPDISRRGFVLTALAGVAVAPAMRLGGGMAADWNPALIRPPGALAEEDFLSRCIKCGQCMRVCPTNIIQPAGIEAGMEGLWTPVLDFRVGTSGCGLNCLACGHVCPTAAIRGFSLDEKHGKNAYAAAGPIRMGTAFVDRGRCLPWAMDKPCIVCQENCPLSPKAIFVKEEFVVVRDGHVAVKRVERFNVEIQGRELKPGQFATGDYFLRFEGDGEGLHRRISGNSETTITLDQGADFQPPPPGASVEIRVRLQRPQVDIERCVGCGICEHECPVSGRRAIRVTAENESRSRKRSLLLTKGK